jgi:hypothetical protein
VTLRGEPVVTNLPARRSVVQEQVAGSGTLAVTAAVGGAPVASNGSRSVMARSWRRWSSANLVQTRLALLVHTTRLGVGYRLVAADGGVFAFGDARFRGSSGGSRPASPVTAIARTSTGTGYWLLTADGGVAIFGDARNFGSARGRRPGVAAIGLTPTVTDDGYTIVFADGAWGYGNALGAAYGNLSPLVGLRRTALGDGSWAATRRGDVYASGNARDDGGLGAIALRAPIVAVI